MQNSLKNELNKKNCFVTQTIFLIKRPNLPFDQTQFCQTTPSAFCILTKFLALIWKKIGWKRLSITIYLISLDWVLVYIDKYWRNTLNKYIVYLFI